MDEEPIGQSFLLRRCAELRACSAALRARSAALEWRNVELERSSTALLARSAALVARCGHGEELKPATGPIAPEAGALASDDFQMPAILRRSAP